MQIPHLSQLHVNMIAQRLTKTKFAFRFRTLVFSVIYIADQFPHELLFGCRANNLFFVVKVRRDYSVSTYLGEAYGALVRALELHPNRANPFSPAVFFNEFAEVVPVATNAGRTPSITEIAIHSRDVEDADKIYFFGWLTHDGKTSSSSKKNLAKTLRLCGYATYQFCSRHNISSRWTDDATKEVQYCEPRGA
ncbi:DUF6037 family protein [Variovorax robiniae]|uniref:DUF6037 family protein n=1 Tax=Variovorax robiniae TaxID=1836199 RepID=UPI003BF5AC90